MKAVVFTLGCKVNDVESGSIIRGLQDAGHEISRGLIFADFYIITKEGLERDYKELAEKTGGKVVTNFDEQDKDAHTDNVTDAKKGGELINVKV